MFNTFFKLLLLKRQQKQSKIVVVVWCRWCVMNAVTDVAYYDDVKMYGNRARKYKTILLAFFKGKVKTGTNTWIMIEEMTKIGNTHRWLWIDANILIQKSVFTRHIPHLTTENMWVDYALKFIVLIQGLEMIWWT